ncbi:hypothetical protein RMCBS344292_03147 [Rhizopus microsporus]|nr:hypothetical protein RMCBS344292_03147 [Rhizopus microsporus]
MIDINKYKILELGILEPIKRILTSKNIRNNELKYWTLMILYQISLSDPLPHVLIDNGFVSLLAKMARLTYGNTNMPKFCMQSLVRITSNVDVAEAKKILLELLDYNIIELISICLRGDDVELIYWAAGLMHEFVIKDVVADKFRQIKGIHTILSGLLSAEEMYISRVILRTIKFMAAGQDKFLQDMVRSGMVKKIMHCLSLNDEDVKQWAILCIHVVAGQVESHQDIITAPEFEILLELAISSKMKVAIYVSDIISLICCITSNATYLEPHIKSLLKTLNTLLLEGESDVQYNAAGAIFNIMTTNTPFANKVRQINFKNILSVATTATNERVQMICTKGALMVVIKNRYMVFQINSQVTDPLIETVNSISRFILPIMISQALVRSTKNQVLGSRTSSIHDDELDPPLMHTDTDDEDIPMMLAILVWHSMINTNKKAFQFYSQLVLAYCSRIIASKMNKTPPPSMMNNPVFVEIDLVSRSKFCFVSYESYLRVRNDSWTFETVRATHCVPAMTSDILEQGEAHKYAYEVILESSGLMQIGWVSDHFEFDPEGGKGVGDDVHSFGYDGSRAKKWHGKYSNMRTTSYGLIWKEGDVVTCAIDMDEGEIRYYLNGIDMGVAFFGISINRTWHPAISLATNQQCKFQFGGSIDPLNYLPEGYSPIAALAVQPAATMKLPPPRRVPKIDPFEETDVADLSKAMEQMSVRSPDLHNIGNIEPNLKPIDYIEQTQEIVEGSTEFTFYFMKAGKHEQSFLPSIYYEVSVAFPKRDDSFDVVPSDRSTIMFGLQRLLSDTFIYFEYQTIEKSLTFVIGSDRSESFEFYVQDGDKIGVLYMSETNAFGITQNGTVKVIVYVGRSTQVEPYLPFVTGSVKMEMNRGENPFRWDCANHASSKQHMSNYLYRLMGKISKF